MLNSVDLSILKKLTSKETTHFENMENSGVKYKFPVCLDIREKKNPKETTN